jgi:competence protein ComEA
MFGTVLSIVALTTLFAVSPSGAAQARPSASQAAKPAAAATVNINTASASDLEGLPGVGAKTAARIVEYRQKNGRISMTEASPNT